MNEDKDNVRGVAASGTDCGDAGRDIIGHVLVSRPSRYAMVRNDAGYKFANPSERASLPQAAYDIVDNVQGAERILAQGVRCLDALLMVEALNDHWLNMITHNDDDC